MTTTIIAPSSRGAEKPTRKVTRRRFRISRDWTLGLILGTLGLVTFVPLIMLFELSFKNEQQMADALWLPALPLHVGNYVRAFSMMGRYMVNSTVFVVGTVTVSIICSTLTAYALARYDFPGREFFFMAILALLMIPGILTLFTTFIVTINLKLNNTNLGIWLPLAAGAQAFQVVVLRTFLASIPEDFFEAARLDGASESQMLTLIALPLAKPIMTTLIVLQVNAVWNEFVWPIMVLSRPERYPATLIIMRLGALIIDRDLGAQYAAYVIAGLPILILFAFASRSFIRGLTSGAIKI